MSSAEMPSATSSTNFANAMKPQTLPTKRIAPKNTVFKRLRAVTGNRKQRAAAATADMEMDDGSSKISRALVIVFLFHIVAIGLVFVHHNFLDSREPDVPIKSAKAKSLDTQNFTPLPVAQPDRPRVEPGENSVVVTSGDNYARIAARLGVDEADLIAINEQADITPGMLLKVPAKRAIPGTQIRVNTLLPSPADEDDGLVDVMPSTAEPTPRAILVKPKSTLPAATPTTSASGKTYVVQNGDSIWRIANKLKVKQDALLKANGLGKDGKIKAGMTLVIPR
jgi:LysM repeat protein